MITDDSYISYHNVGSKYITVETVNHQLKHIIIRKFNVSIATWKYSELHFRTMFNT